MLRRKFVTSAGLATVGQVIASRRLFSQDDAPQSTAAPMLFESAMQAAAAIQQKQISSVELTKSVFDRISRFEPQLNAFAYLLEETALARAADADTALAKGESWGPFHGVPVHVKESFAVAGQPCTWGLKAFKDTKASDDSDVVSRLRASGAILIGATNVAEALSDCQSHNSVYGTTNNPWDLQRTAGGSSGGSAAALAAGLGFLSVGSDLAGSIRTPAHFCGVYGHKPSLNFVSLNGHSPGGNRRVPADSELLAVCGPMARSAADLGELLRALGGATGAKARAWQWKLPPSRHRKLSEFRVGYVLDDPFAPVSTASREVLDQTVEMLSRNCASIKEGWPSGFSPESLTDNYWYLMDAFSLSSGPEIIKKFARTAVGTAKAQPGVKPYIDWQAQDVARLEFRSRWQDYFRNIDVFLMPVSVTEAFKHDRRAWSKRTIESPVGPRPYEDHFRWASFASLTGCPATSAPVGRTKDGMPIGIQIMGPFCEDATTIEFAQLLANEIGGFTPPSTLDQIRETR